MSYNKKTYANTDETVTYEDMNRIEQGIYDNDVEISNMKDPSKEGSIAKQIADNAEQINVLNGNYTNLSKKALTSKTTAKTNLFEITEPGIYITPNSGIADLPPGWNQGRHVLIVFGTGNYNYSSQIIMPYAGATSNKKMAFRVNLIDGSIWMELVTTTALQSALDALNA